MDFDLNAYRSRILNILHAQRDALPWSGSLNEYYQTVYQRLLDSLAQQFL